MFHTLPKASKSAGLHINQTQSKQQGLSYLKSVTFKCQNMDGFLNEQDFNLCTTRIRYDKSNCFIKSIKYNLKNLQRKEKSNYYM